MKTEHATDDDWKTGLRSLRQVLQERDAQRAFDRCIVGGEGCKNPSIEAHSIPMACLQLIANRNSVFASCAVPPPDPVTYHYLKPLARRSISTFSVSRWSCEGHDRLFAPVDSKNIDLQDRRNLFLLVYRTTLTSDPTRSTNSRENSDRYTGSCYYQAPRSSGTGYPENATVCC